MTASVSQAGAAPAAHGLSAVDRSQGAIATSLRFVFVTPLDIETLLNNREHHAIEQYRRRGHEVTIVYKRTNRSSRFRDLLRDSLTATIRERSADGVRYIAVDPPFNYFGGLRRNADAAACPSLSGRLRRAALRIIWPLSILRDVFATPWMWWAARRATREASDVCLGFGPWGGLVGLLLRRGGRVCTLVYEDRDAESGLMPDRLRRGYTAAVERFCMRRADLVISIGHLLAARRREERVADPHVIPSGVNWQSYARARREPCAEPTLIYVGNVTEWSGIEHAIAALPRIREAFSGATLLVVGTGVPNYLARLRRAAEALPPDAVRFLGHQAPETLPAHLGAARIGLANAEPVPFRRYATPLKLIEYMAAGLPAITTEGTEAAAIVTGCDCGIAIPYDPDAFAEAVVALLSDEAAYARQRENGIRHSRDYDSSLLIARELALIEAVRRGDDR